MRDITDAAVLNVATSDVFSASLGEGAWLNGKPAAYVCENFTCQAPVTESAALEKLL